MFIKDPKAQESFIHVCRGNNIRQMKSKELEIRRHDIKTFTIVPDENGKPVLVDIKFCPYCGYDLQNE